MEQKGLDFGQTARDLPGKRRALSVAELTDRLQGVLETEFFDVWVEGEISNLNQAASGHWYFSLKDDRAQIRAVVWKTAARLIKWKPKDGMRVLARGGIKVYAPRGDYQISVEVLEPLGVGSLQQAFEEMKERLSKEGLFDPAKKRPLPMLPRLHRHRDLPHRRGDPGHPARPAAPLREPGRAHLPGARAGARGRVRDRAGHPRAEPRSRRSTC